MRRHSVKHIIPKLILHIAIILLPSCAMFAPDTPNDLSGDMPASYTAEVVEANSKLQNDWWRHFKSDELNALIEQSITTNLNLKQVYARLMQAESSAVQGGVGFFPTITGTGMRNTTNTHTAGQGGNSVNSYNLGALASYELDLWGRVRSNANNSDYTYQASAEDVNAARATLAAEVTTRWLNIITYKKRITVKQKQLTANLTHLELMELRFRKGHARALDIYQQQQSVALIESQLPKLVAQLVTYKNQLAVLLGKMPGPNYAHVNETELPHVNAVPHMGVPADLLANRPDVRKAMMKLQAANWTLSAAKSDMLPKISLSASYAYGAETSAALFDNWLSTLAANLTAPIFQGGYKIAEVTKSEAIVDERLSGYKETVLNAIGEVENAFVNEKKQKEYIIAVRKNRDASQASYDESFMRYRKGVNTYLPVLTALTSLQSLEDELIKAEQDALIYRINLYKALGRGWQ